MIQDNEDQSIQDQDDRMQCGFKNPNIFEVF